MKKQEIERIAQARASTPYRYPMKSITNTSATSSPTRDEEVFEDCMDIRPDQLSTNSKKPPRAPKFLAAGGLPIPQLSQKKPPRSRSRSPVKTTRNSQLASPKKSLTPRNPNGENPHSKISQSDRPPLGPRDLNAVSTRSMGIVNSTLLQ